VFDASGSVDSTGPAETGRWELISQPSVHVVSQNSWQKICKSQEVVNVDIDPVLVVAWRIARCFGISGQRLYCNLCEIRQHLSASMVQRDMKSYFILQWMTPPKVCVLFLPGGCISDVLLHCRKTPLLRPSLAACHRQAPRMIGAAIQRVIRYGAAPGLLIL
jgi:hypothetical protein